VTRRLRYSRKAVADLDQIWNYTQRNWGTDQAERYISAIRGQCQRLVEGELVAARYQPREIPFLRIRSGSHLAFLVEQDDQLLVVRIIHIRQDPARELD
jgi:toxin ParE1/3/4